MSVRVDGPTALSNSTLWRSLRAFYEEQGPAAFTSGVVPWRITSCPLLAASYADASAAFARDAGARSRAAPRGPLQIVELGGGTGRLAFHLMRALDARQVDFHYQFTDASASTVTAAGRHPQLQPWIERGRLSIQRLDALDPARLEVGEGPVVVVANYLFDSLPHDAWRADGGEALAQHVELWSPELGAALEHTDWKFVEATAPADPPVLGYAARVGSGRFLWPTGPIASLSALAARLRRPHLWLIADKGPATADEVRGQDTASLAKHGCVSALVNFDALRAWAGWRPFLGPAQAQMRFGAYALVQGLREVPQLREAWQESAAANLPLQAVKLFEQLAAEPAALPQLLQALAFTRFDPDSLLKITASLRERLSAQTPAELVGALVAALDATWENHFALEEHNDLAFEIATVLHRAGQLSHAVGYYRRSAAACGPDAATFFNLALCLLDLGRRDEARQALETATRADPRHDRARALLAATA